MKFKKGDKVILNLRTSSGNLCIDMSEHNKEFTIINYYTKANIEIQRPGIDWYWYVRSEMITLADPQLVFEFMKEG